MNFWFLTIILLLPSVSHGLEEQASLYRPNLVSRILNDILDNILKPNLTIGNVTLGEMAKFSSVEVIFSNITKKIDGDGSYGLKFSLNISKLLVTGYYDLKGFEIPDLFPIFGKGNFSILLEEIAVDLNMKARQNFDTDSFDITIPVFEASLENATLNFENLMYDSDLANFLNELLSNLLPDLVRVIHKQVIYILQPAIQYVMNEVIKCIKNELATGKLDECLRNITRIGYDIRLGEEVRLALQNLPALE